MFKKHLKPVFPTKKINGIVNNYSSVCAFVF